MFIHLGGNQMIHISEVVTILDAGSRYSPSNLRPFLTEAEKQGHLAYITTQEDIKSYVVTETMIYASPISSLTLMKRGKPGNNRTTE